MHHSKCLYIEMMYICKIVNEMYSTFVRVFCSNYYTEQRTISIVTPKFRQLEIANQLHMLLLPDVVHSSLTLALALLERLHAIVCSLPSCAALPDVYQARCLQSCRDIRSCALSPEHSACQLAYHRITHRATFTSADHLSTALKLYSSIYSCTLVCTRLYPQLTN